MTILRPFINIAQSSAETQRTLTFPEYKDWRNYGRLKNEIPALYELIQTGRRAYFE